MMKSSPCSVFSWGVLRMAFLFILASSAAHADFWKELGEALEVTNEVLNKQNQPASGSTAPAASGQQTKRDYKSAKIDFMISLEQVKEQWGEPTRTSNQDHRFEFKNEFGDVCIVYIDRNGETILHVLRLAPDAKVPNYELKKFLAPSYPSYGWKSFGYAQEVNGKEVPYIRIPSSHQQLISSHGKYVVRVVGAQGLDYHTFIVYDSSLYDFMVKEGYNPFSWGNTDPLDQFLYGSSSQIYPQASSQQSESTQRPGVPEVSNLKRGQWKILQDTGDDIFPSMVMGMSQFGKIVKKPGYYGDYVGLLGVEIVSASHGEKVTVSVSGTSFIKPSSLTATLGRPGEVLKIYPLLEYDFDKLLKLRQPRPETITYSVEVNGGAKEVRKKRVNFRSINDCPLLGGVAVENEDESFDQLFACYVNENHPIVDEILSEALKCGMINSFIGYQGGTAVSVEDQVFALWYALQARGVRYSSITTPSLSGGIPSQHVRFIHESLKNSQANCVDGSVLLCSLLRKIGINSELILVPGHCFISYDQDQRGFSKVYLETTVIGNVDLARISNDADKMADSLLSFYQAQESANDTARKYLFTSLIGAERQFIQLDIAEARDNGFMPISVE